MCEDFVSTVKLTGDPIGEPWTVNGWDADDDWEFTSAATTHPSTSTPSTTAPSTATGPAWPKRWLPAGSTPTVHAASDEGEHASLRRLVCDQIEEYGRHTGPRRPPP